MAFAWSPNSRVWLLWLVAAAMVPLMSHNPVYLVASLASSLLVARVTVGRARAVVSFAALLRMTLIVLLLSTLFNALVVRYGETTLVAFPRAIPIVGGAVTAEAAVFGAATGLKVAALLAAFLAFNNAVNHYQLLRDLPPFLHRAGVVLSIAVLFVPQTLTSLREIREAQRLRGYRGKGVRAWLPLFVPLVAEGLERSIQLAESMEARGFGVRRQETGCSSGLLVVRHALAALGVVGLLGAAFVYFYFASLWWLALTAGGASISGLAFYLWQTSSATRSTRYRGEPWLPGDFAAALLYGLLAAFLLYLWVWQRQALLYYPYPRLMLPPVQGWLLAALLALGLPGAAAIKQEREP